MLVPDYDPISDILVLEGKVFENKEVVLKVFSVLDVGTAEENKKGTKRPSKKVPVQVEVTFIIPGNVVVLVLNLLNVLKNVIP